MIPSYSDHAANERTFLAWIRTGLTIMALGFVIERLDLFLETLGGTGPDTLPPVHAPEIQVLSVALVSLAIVLIVGAGYRFVDINRAIEDQAVHPFKATLMPLGMALVLLCVGILLLLYLLRLI
jgi:putative membrane protein